MMSYAWAILFAAIQAVVALLLWRLADAVKHQQDQLHCLWSQVFGPGDLKARLDSRPSPMFDSFTLPPPGPPPAQDPDEFALSHMPDEIAAVVEAQDQETAGTSSRNTCAAWSEGDEREAQMEDDYTATLARKIRRLAGEDC